MYKKCNCLRVLIFISLFITSINSLFANGIYFENYYSEQVNERYSIDNLANKSYETANLSINSEFNIYSLQIPRIDTPDQMSAFSVLLEFNGNSGTWKINSLEKSSIDKNLIEDVKLEIRESSPAQVFLLIKTNIPTQDKRCPVVHFSSEVNISQRQINNKFEITLYSNYLSEKSNSFLEQNCILQGTNVWVAYPLKVFGLKAGAYEYIVNNTHLGSFELKNDNVLPIHLFE